MDAYDVFWMLRWMLRPVLWPLFRPARVHHACRQILHENPNVVAVPRFLQILKESLEIMEQTTNPGTFFSRYDTAVDMAESILETSYIDEHIAYAEEVLDVLLSEQDRIAIDFVNRCKAKGNLWFVKDALLENDTVFSEEAKVYLLEVLEQDEQEYQT